MKEASFGPDTARYLENGKWASRDVQLRTVLNEVSAEERAKYSPADGHPRNVVFLKSVERLGGTITIDDETIEPSKQEVIH